METHERERIERLLHDIALVYDSNEYFHRLFKSRLGMTSLRFRAAYSSQTNKQ